MTKHRHHIVPRHDGGDDSELNVTPPISVRLHAAFHYDRWKALRQIGDYVAWRMLTGQMSASEAARFAQLEGARKGGLVSGPMLKGRRSVETLAKLSASHMGLTRSPEAIAKASAAITGRKRPPFSAEWKANISEAHKGLKWRPESIVKMRLKLTGRKCSDQTKAAMSEAQKKRRAAERERLRDTTELLTIPPVGGGTPPPVRGRQLGVDKGWLH